MMKLSPQLVGEAGVHFVISALTLKGLIAVGTSRNVKGPDVIVTNPDGTWFAAIQVKTRRNTKEKFWNVGDRGLTWGGPNCWYAFVRINNDQPEAFMAEAGEVKKFAQADRDEMTRRGHSSGRISWGFSNYFVKLLNDSEIEQRARRQWEVFNLCQSAKAKRQ
jgi:hypothetical protein